MIKNHISGNLYNELFSKSSEEKCMASSRIVHKNAIKNCSAVLQQSKHFPPCISLGNLCFPFHKGKDTSAIPQPSAQYLLCAEAVLRSCSSKKVFLKI